MKKGTNGPSSAFMDKYSRHLAAGLTGIVILFTAAVRLRLLSVPLERDEGEYAYAGQLLLKGMPPYLFAYNMKFPGVYGAYALTMAAFGQTPAGIRLGLMLVNAATIILVFLLSRRLLDSYAAVVAAASFAVLSLGQSVLGTFAHATHYVVLFAVAGLLALLKWIDTGRALPLCLSGVLLGLAVLMKQHGIFFAAFGVLYLCWHELRVQRASWSGLLKSGGVLLAGIAVPLVVTCAALIWAGVFGRFRFWTFTYASTYVSQVPLSAGLDILSAKLGRITNGSGLLWLVGLTGALTLWWNESVRQKRAFVAGLMILSFFAVCPGLYFREHYFVLTLPGVALLTGVATSSMRQFLRKRKAIRSYRWAPALLLVAVLAICLLEQRAFLFQLSPLQASRATYGRNPFPETLEAAKYIKANSDAVDRIAVLGSEPQVYFYADRLSASGHIYMYGLMEPQPYAAQMQQEMIGEIERNAPRFLVYVPANESWLKRPGSEGLVFDWMAKYIKNEFNLVGVAEIVSLDTTRYYWDDEARTHSSRASPSLLVYKRKDAPRL